MEAVNKKMRTGVKKIGKILLKGSISTLKMMVLRRWKIHTFRLRAKR